ncbi:serine hydrolase [Crenobacter cavernae]|uniref:Peptidase S11 n=1 Tax=Crenobacter cavernae TaxID=2290923 RepID=A0A345Y770_9NEIS|nr:serine hydrolase [Crenobacter cavernae]AXK39772.1 peptidase S11 [Crenobacter cavernae]RXZ44141.1 peptidase S11 [Crenobacter cavernae]
MLKTFAGWLLSAAMASAFAAPALTDVRGVQVASQMASQAPLLSSHSVLVMNSQTGEALYQKNINQRLPIASITKLMTAMVVLDAGLDLNEAVTISDAEIDRLKNTHSRLAVGSTLTRRELLLLALMSSENRAAAALARSYPGGTAAFVARMNRKARALGMRDAAFYDATGLDLRNSATAADLALMVKAAYGYPLIRQDSTTQQHAVYSGANRLLQYKNSNALVRGGEWDIGLQKTGYIQEAGRCMVLHATVGSQPLVIVLLAANGPAARVNDAKAIRTWLEGHPGSWLAG